MRTIRRPTTPIVGGRPDQDPGPREQLILTLRFGLGGESPRTLIEVSQVLGVSKERVRQIQDRAWSKARTSPAGDEFRASIEALRRLRDRCREKGARWNAAEKVR